MNASLILGRVAGSLFVLAGTFKVLLGMWHLWQPTAPDFGTTLAQLGVPFAPLFAWAVPLIEIVGGACLLRGRLVRVCAAILAVDMAVAIVLVGWPGWRGRALNIGNQAIGQEAWRLPLELGLLAAMLWLLCKPHEKQ